MCFTALARPPRFKKKRRTRPAVDIPRADKLHVRRLGRHVGEFAVPNVGRVRFRWTRPLPGVTRDLPGRITGARFFLTSSGGRRVTGRTLHINGGAFTTR